MNVLIFVLVLFALDVLLNFFTRSFVKMLGMDLLFIGSWFAGVEYGVGPGILISILLLIEHTLFFMGKGRFIILSLPVQILAVFLGHFLGMNYFLLSLVVYQLGNVLTMFLIKAIGPRFAIFLFFNTIFNLVLFKILVFISF